MNPGHHIDYKQLRGINPEAARQAVLDYRERREAIYLNPQRSFRINRCSESEEDFSTRPGK